MTWKYDMLGNICFQHSTDAGNRWIVRDVMGKTLRVSICKQPLTWNDERRKDKVICSK